MKQNESFIEDLAVEFGFVIGRPCQIKSQQDCLLHVGDFVMAPRPRL